MRSAGRVGAAWLLALSTVPIPESLSAQVCGSPATLEEVTRIGTLLGDVTLSTVTDITVGPDGNVYVGQASDAWVAVFGPEGEPKPAVGRAGDGPGEFRSGPRYVAWKADTLVAIERFGAYFFDLEGAEVRRVSFRVRFPAESSTFVAGLPLADGSFLGRRFWTPPTRLFYTAEDLAVRRFDEDGNVLSTITTVDHSVPAIGNRTFRLEFENRHLAHPLGWYEPSSFLPIAVMGDGTAIVYVERVEAPRGAAFDLLKIGIDGDTILHRTIPYDPVEISSEERRAVTDAFVEGFVGGEQGREGERLRDEARQALDLGVAYPPVRGIVAGTDGSIWLLRESSPRPVDRWEIYGSTGELERSVVIREGRSREAPWYPRVQLFHATRTEAWGVTRDDFGVPYIHHFRVVPPCGNGSSS